MQANRREPERQEDIIIDMVQRCAAILANPPLDAASQTKALQDLEKGLRADWGGDRPYIAHRRGDGHSERNSRIMRAHQQGKHIAWMAKKENLSERRVTQIIATLRAARRPQSAG